MSNGKLDCEMEACRQCGCRLCKQRMREIRFEKMRERLLDDQLGEFDHCKRLNPTRMTDAQRRFLKFATQAPLLPSGVLATRKR